MYQAYPLQWPVGYSRSARKRSSRFKTSLGRSRDFVKDEVKRLNGKDLVISTNIPLKQDGDLRADWNRFKLEDTGVAVYFNRKGKEVCLCCDTYEKVWENLYAIGRTIEALRQIERDGVSDFLDRTFSGFPALPESTTAEKDIWLTLGLQVKPAVVDAVHTAYKQKAKLLHPDMPDGDEVYFIELQRAYKKALTFFPNI